MTCVATLKTADGTSEVFASVDIPTNDATLDTDLDGVCNGQDKCPGDDALGLPTRQRAAARGDSERAGHSSSSRMSNRNASASE